MMPEEDGALGEKKKLCSKSPRPDWLAPAAVTSPWAMIGRMVREMTLASGLIDTGITGWTFKV